MLLVNTSTKNYVTSQYKHKKLSSIISIISINIVNAEIENFICNMSKGDNLVLLNRAIALPIELYSYISSNLRFIESGYIPDFPLNFKILIYAFYMIVLDFQNFSFIIVKQYHNFQWNIFISLFASHRIPGFFLDHFQNCPWIFPQTTYTFYSGGGGGMDYFWNRPFRFYE